MLLAALNPSLSILKSRNLPSLRWFMSPCVIAISQPVISLIRKILKNYLKRVDTIYCGSHLLITQYLVFINMFVLSFVVIVADKTLYRLQGLDKMNRILSKRPSQRNHIPCLRPC